MKKLINLVASGVAALALLAFPALSVAQSLNPATSTTTRPTSELGALREIINPATRWTYVAASGGIINTTGVVAKTAVPGKRIYVRSCQLANSGAAGTEVLLNSGAAGTVLWRGYLPAAATLQPVVFEVPLQTAQSALLEIVLSSATTVAVRVNCQGYTD